MYNGIGLQTARGSGTNGYVQTNKFFIRPRTGGPPKAPFPSYDDGGAGAGGLGGMRKPNKEILEHDRKRQVELRLVLLRDTLEDQGYTEGEIEDRVEEARREAEIEAAAAAVVEEAGGKAPAGRPGEGYGSANCGRIIRVFFLYICQQSCSQVELLQMRPQTSDRYMTTIRSCRASNLVS
jgi:serine/arginine repetitive matrix protein 2